MIFNEKLRRMQGLGLIMGGFLDFLLCCYYASTSALDVMSSRIVLTFVMSSG